MDVAGSDARQLQRAEGASSRVMSDFAGAHEEVRHLVDGLCGRVVPPLLLAASCGDPVSLESFASGSGVIYLYPGATSSPDGGESSLLVDAAQHRGFRDLGPDMSVLKLTVVGVSTQSQDAQIRSVVANRLQHTLLSDPQLLLADRLELPTFACDGARWYRRLTIVVRHGRIGKVFYPVEGARNPAQVIAWAKVQGS